MSDKKQFFNEFGDRPIVRGEEISAEYSPQYIEQFKGNPLIEAIPLRESLLDIAKVQAYFPKHSPLDRQQSEATRLDLVYNARMFIQPTANFLNLASAITRTLRWSYVGRNPVDPRYIQTIRNPLSQAAFLKLPSSIPASSAGSFYLIGPPGIGKSLAIERTLKVYPQTILHKRYNKRSFTMTQLLWLKLDCPSDGSIKALCIAFFRAVDAIMLTNHEHTYVEKKKGSDANILLQDMKVVASEINLGLLVIDEIQNLNRAASGGSGRLLNFFVELMNSSGIPVVLIGTLAAQELLTQEFRLARRGTGQGDFVWQPMQRKEDEWKNFLTSLWHYQYTATETELNDTLDHALFTASHGIADIAAKIYMLVQIRLISLNSNALITKDHIWDVTEDNMRLPQKVLTALREGKHKGNLLDEKYLADVYISDKSLKESIDRGRRMSASDVDLVDLATLRDYDTPMIDALAELRKRGVDNQLAIETVSKAMASLGADASFKALMPIVNAFLKGNTLSDRPSSRKKSPRLNNAGLKLLEIVEDGKNLGQSPVKALQIAGYIKDAMEVVVESAEI